MPTKIITDLHCYFMRDSHNKQIAALKEYSSTYLHFKKEEELLVFISYCLSTPIDSSHIYKEEMEKFLVWNYINQQEPNPSFNRNLTIYLDQDSDFDGFEINPLCYVEEGMEEQCEPEEAEFWGVFAHMEYGGVSSIADFQTKEEAEHFVDMLNIVLNILNGVEYLEDDEAVSFTDSQLAYAVAVFIFLENESVEKEKPVDATLVYTYLLESNQLKN